MSNKLLKFLSQNGSPTRVKAPFDETDSVNQSLDHYLTDETVIRVLRETWKKPVNDEFYGSTASILRDAFFSRPYPKIASNVLGYPEGYDADFAIEDDQLDERASSKAAALPATSL